jgi:predicted O-methyltransferase YrrM
MAEIARQNFKKFTEEEWQARGEGVEGVLEEPEEEKKIWLREGEAMETLENLKEEDHKFDFIFIDADKRR